MVKFAHMADIHLGGWKQPELQKLNFESFKKALDICINEKVDFVLISGDLFDSAYPSIEVLKVADFEEKENEILLNPIIHEGIALYGYPGKKSGLEINDLRKVKLNQAPGMFKILMLHTTLDKAKGTLPIDALEADLLPKVDYYALGHLHMDFQYENFVYPGPLFPNNFQELEDLQHGGFYIVHNGPHNSFNRIKVPIKEVVSFNIEINDALAATEKIISELEQKDLEDKIVLLRLKGELEKGKNSDIRFNQIEEFVKQKKVYFLLKNTRDLKTRELELEIDVEDTGNMEEETIKIYSEENPSGFNDLIFQLINSFAIEKQEGETTDNFSNRLLEEAKKILKF